MRCTLLRYDVRHYMAVLLGFLSEGEIDRAKGFLKEYAETFEDSGEVPLCQNIVVDVIARRYAALAKAQGIEIEFLLSLHQQAGIADTDLCIVLGNPMENAMHACAAKQEGEKFLHVLAKAEGPDVFISVENSCCPEPSPSGGGLGISSVQAVAKKYGGFAKFERKGDVFHAAVLMYPEPPGATAPSGRMPLAIRTRQNHLHG